MKIVFITPTLELHGGNIVMLKYAEFLVRQGNSVSIITTSKLIEFEIDPRITVVQYKKFPIKWIDFFTFQLVYLFKIKKALKNIGEVDFYIPIYGPLIVLTIFAKRRLSLSGKIIPLFQDSFQTLYVGPYLRWLVKRKYVQSGITSLITISSPLAKEYEDLTGKQAIYIPNGIDSDHFYPRDTEKENYVLFVGRTNKPKGFFDFLKAFELARLQIPELTAKIVGPNVESKKDGPIEYIHYENRDQLAQIYSDALLYLNVSYAESFALPPLEAMASGTATIITNTGGEQEYALDGENTTIIPVGNPKKAAEAVVKLYQDNKLHRKYESEGIKTAQKYGWEISLKKFENLLQEMS